MWRDQPAAAPGTEGSITQRDALDFVPQITEALQHAHEAGVVHRDIKPENVLVDSLGRVRLVDFGLATILGPKPTTRTADDDRVVGTLRYMAPEQITMPQAVDHRADIYSTGVVFYEMLAHELPGTDRVPPSRKAATDPRLDPIVLRAIEIERDRRYQEAQLLHHDITSPVAHARVDDPHRAAHPRPACAGVRGLDRPRPRWPTGMHPPTISARPSGEVDPQVGGAVSRRHALARSDGPPIRFRAVLPDGCTPDLELHLGLGTSQARLE